MPGDKGWDSSHQSVPQPIGLVTKDGEKKTVKALEPASTSRMSDAEFEQGRREMEREAFVNRKQGEVAVPDKPEYYRNQNVIDSQAAQSADKQNEKSLIPVDETCEGCEDKWTHLKGTIKEWLSQSNSDKPKIIMTGDGHRTPPFAYAEGNEFIKKEAQRKQLFLYVEATQEDVDANLNNFVPKTMQKGFFAKGPTRVIGWEPQMSQLMKQTFEDIMASLSIEQENRKNMFDRLLAQNTRIFDELLEENESLAVEFNTASNKHLASIDPENKNFSDMQVANDARDIMRIVSGSWRDDYINPVIGKRIAKNITENPNATFLISIGDCHLNVNPIQKHISEALGDIRLTLSHDFIIDHSSGVNGSKR
ncbi:hypothetical protein [Shewanella sp.]|uniref:hypothetical protein n=1 Tax=Shewanella sp. TaxID=50422 RepID=UPI0025827D07|nr:hypothetical protein [Shewanella sp.]MCJ8302996.1 hypothetical protein [Shewanella sp.]